MTPVSLFRRWLLFNAVGLVGAVLQLALLKALTTWGGLNYLAATAIAIECTVLHNFCWHQGLTWKDRKSTSLKASAGRCLRFNLSNGLISLTGNLLLMRLLVGSLHIGPMVANVMAIVVCSFLNFFLSHALIFTASGHLNLEKGCSL